jgi:hypothetical protein
VEQRGEQVVAVGVEAQQPLLDLALCRPLSASTVKAANARAWRSRVASSSPLCASRSSAYSRVRMRRAARRRRSPGKNLLEVVDHQQRRERVVADGLGELRGHPGRIVECGEGDEARAVRDLRRALVRELEREARLADAARPGEREEPHP